MEELETILDKNSFVEELNYKLSNGAVIAFVTDTVWGIGCLPSSEKGVNRIYEIKGRDRSKPLILMSNKEEYLLPYVDNISVKAKELMEKYFPGALTIINEKSPLTPAYITSGKNTVGIRVPDNEIFRKLCSKINGHVLATTSANLSNQPSGKNYEEVKKSIGHLADYIIEDYGYTAKGIESTVILAINDDIKILRQGSINI